MIYNFPKHKSSSIASKDMKRFLYKEQLSIEIAASMVRNGMRVTEFTPNTAKDVWRMASFLAEERFHHEIRNDDDK